MKICGVVAEYNPFHNGHAYHLAKTRHVLGSDLAIVCVMSGNFVQRGDFAALEKYHRAQAAALNGADLVLELPLGAALSSAEGFAHGAVLALEALGAVQYLSFGSECGSARALAMAARAIGQPAAQNALREALKEGLSYAAARQRSLAVRDPQIAALLDSPNNILGLEYCRALQATDSLISPLSIRRQGAAHDSEQPSAETASASWLRTRLRTGALEDCQAHMPPTSFALLMEAVKTGSAPVPSAAVDIALLSHLRRLSAKDLARYERPDEGFTNRLQQAVLDATSWKDACTRAQTRRYPLSRVRRALLRSFLDIPLSSLSDPPAYLRVLAIGPRGRELLRLFSAKATIPLITKPLHEKELPAAMQNTLARDVLADELFALAMPENQYHAGGSHFRHSPFCVPSGHVVRP